MLLVTGAAGHVGNAFIRNLLEHGHTRIRALLLFGEDASPLAGLPIELVEGDITRPETLAEAFHGVRQVAHLASLVSIGDSGADLVERVNVQGARNVLQAAQAAGVERFMYVGSVHAFVPPETGGLDETRPLMPETAEPYERTKAAATRLMLEAARRLDVVIVAPSGVIGPLDFKRSEMGGQFLAWTKSSTFTGIPGGYDFADVRDVADGLRLALEHGKRGEIYLLGGEFIELTQAARSVMQSVHGRAQVRIIPLNVAYAMSHVALQVSKFLKKKPMFTPYSVKTLQAKYFVDSSKARRELGYSTRPLSDTLRDTAQWWLDHPDLGGKRRAG